MANLETLNSTIYYLDMNTQYQIDGQDILLENVKAINNQIFNILTTVPGERIFEPEFGSDLPLLLFEPIDDITAWQMETAIYQALERWQPRIQVIYNATSVVANPDLQSFDCTIAYQVRLKNITNIYRVRLRQ